MADTGGHAAGADDRYATGGGTHVTGGTDPPWVHPAPPGIGPPPPPAAPEPPPSVRQAITLMWIGAALSVLGGLLGFFMQDQVREEVERQLDRQGNPSGLDPDTFVTIGLVAGAVGATIGAGLWILHAVSARRGRSWARISGTVLFAVSVLFFLVGLTQPAPGLSRGMGLLQQLVGLGAVVLLWLRPSSDFFAASDRARRGY